MAKPTEPHRKKMIKKRETPQVNEPVKSVLFFKGTTTSEPANLMMKDLFSLKKPDAVMFSKKNDVRPFEDTMPLEFLAEKNNTPLMVFSHHSKKRPNGLTFIRFFDNKVMDMVEMCVDTCVPMDVFDGIEKTALGNRPLMTFSGIEFDMDMGLKSFKNMMIDMFRGEITVNEVNLKGVEHVMAFSTLPVPEGQPPKISLHVYRITLEKSASTTPRVELHEEMGPACVLRLGRVREAEVSTWKQAIKVPKELVQKKTKNVEFSAVGDKLGRVHMNKQDFDKLQTRKVKALKRTRETDADDE